MLRWPWERDLDESGTRRARSTCCRSGRPSLPQPDRQRSPESPKASRICQGPTFLNSTSPAGFVVVIANVPTTTGPALIVGHSGIPIPTPPGCLTHCFSASQDPLAAARAGVDCHPSSFSSASVSAHCRNLGSGCRLNPATRCRHHSASHSNHRHRLHPSRHPRSHSWPQSRQGL